MAMQDINAGFLANDVPTSTARLLQSIIQPIPTCSIDGSADVKSLEPEQTTAIVRALFIASLDQFFQTTKWTGSDDLSATREMEMCEAARGVFHCALGGELVRSPSFLVQRFREQTTLEDLFRRARGLSHAPNQQPSTKNNVDLEEELATWLLVRLYYSAALIRNAPNDKLSPPRWNSRINFIHQIEKETRLVHTLLFCSADKELRELKTERVQEIGKLWVTLEEELRALIMGWVETTRSDQAAQETGWIQLLGVDRRTQLPMPEGQVPSLQLDRRPFIIPIWSKSHATNLLLTALRMHLSIIHHSIYFTDTIPSAIEALITLWEYEMKRYPCHDQRVFEDLVQLLMWLLNDNARTESERTETLLFCKSTSPICLDKLTSVVIEQTRHLFPYTSQRPPNQLASHRMLTELALAILRARSTDQDHSTASRTSRTIHQVVVKFGSLMVNFLAGTQQPDLQSWQGEHSLLCMALLISPNRTDSSHVWSSIDPKQTFPSYQLLNQASISQLERFLVSYQPSRQPPPSGSHDGTHLAGVHSWLADRIEELRLQLESRSESLLNRKRKRGDNEENLSLSPAEPSGPPQAPNTRVSGHYPIHRADPINARVSLWLRDWIADIEPSPDFNLDGADLFILNSVKKLSNLLQPPPELKDNKGMCQKWQEATRRMELLSSLVCVLSLRGENTSDGPQNSSMLANAFSQPSFECLTCDRIKHELMSPRYPRRTLALEILQTVVELCRNSALLVGFSLEGGTDEVSRVSLRPTRPQARLALSGLLFRVLNHVVHDAQGASAVSSDLNSSFLMIFLDLLESGSRMERVAAGRVIAAAFSVSLSSLQACQSKQYSDCSLGDALRRLETMVTRGSWKIQETLTVALVRCFEACRTVDQAMLDDGVVDLNNCLSYQLFSILLRQMCKKNSYLLGAIRNEILSLSKRSAVSVYTLLARFLPSLCQVIVVDLKFDSHGASLLADLLGMSMNVFLVQTARYTVPLLVLHSNVNILRSIAAAKGETLAELLVHQAAGIVSRLCLQTETSKLELASRGFLTLLNEGRETTRATQPLEMSILLQGSAGIIYFRLIVEISDDSDTSTRLAHIKSALWRAYQFKHPHPNWNIPINDKELQQDLKSNTLAILSQINESLQETRGKTLTKEKIKVMQGLGDLIRLVDSGISGYIPQIMNSLQASLTIPSLRSETLQTWDLFVQVTPSRDLRPFVAQITATLVGLWDQMTLDQMGLSLRILGCIVSNQIELDPCSSNIVDLSTLSIPSNNLSDSSKEQSLLKQIQEEQRIFKRSQFLIDPIAKLVERVNSESEVVIKQALKELLALFELEDAETTSLTSGDSFDPIVGDVIKALIGVTARCNDVSDELKRIAFECLGRIGAVDPDRCEITSEHTQAVFNFADPEESIDFAIYLIEAELVGAYRSTHDSKHHHFLTYAIQELLRFCGFTEDILDTKRRKSLNPRLQMRWASIPKQIVDSISPLLASKFKFSFGSPKTSRTPIYKHTSTYSSWLQHWLLRLIPLVEDPNTSKIFSPFLGVVRNGDTIISRRLLPHVALHIVVSASPQESENVKLEIITVLQDQVVRQSSFSPEGRQLVAQTIFELMDHFRRWVRYRQKQIESAGFKRRDPGAASDSPILRVQSIIDQINPELIASAALNCKDHARALLNLEQQIRTIQEKQSSNAPSNMGLDAQDLLQDRIQKYYEKAHEIYAAIDEPDGMEGLSAKILAPSILHRIREHESTGRWTSAQSCWEVELQRQPDELRSHLGLLRCLRNLGHYDSLKAHITGVLQTHPNWESDLAPFVVESSLVSNDWKGLTRAVQVGSSESPEVIFGRVIETLINSHESDFNQAMKDARIRLGNQILGTSRQDAYRRNYDSAIYLHILHEVPLIDQVCRSTYSVPNSNETAFKGPCSVKELMARLDSRLDLISPTFRHREQVLRLRRAAFQLRSRGTPVVGQLWAQTAKIARRAGHLQSSYSAVLQACELKAPTAFMQMAKLIKLEDQPHKAIIELDSNLKNSSAAETTRDQLGDITSRDYAKAALQRVRWMDEVDRYAANSIISHFEKLCQENPHWASPYYYFGRFYDERASQSALNTRLPPHKIRVTTAEYTYHCCKNFTKSLACGTKFIYQALPRMLTLYFSMGEHPDLLQIFKAVDKKARGQDIRQEDYTRALQADELGSVFLKLDRSMHTASRKLPVFEWLTVLPQVVSRVMHKSTHVQAVVHKILTHVLRSYPDQALWAMVSGVESSNVARSSRCVWVLNDAKDFSTGSRSNEHDNGVDALSLTAKIEQCRKLVRQLLKLCNHPIKTSTKQLSLYDTFPGLRNCAPCDLIIPLQSSLIASLPPHGVNFALHQPFSCNLPTIAEFGDKVSIMASLQKPRKIIIHGSDGLEYAFLCKPKDDLRKDARLMEFTSMINKLLKKDSESRKRNLHIRTYAVAVLNEECGLLEWVPNTIPFRNILISLYTARGISLWNPELKGISERIRKHREDFDKVKQIFEREVLSKFPSVFHLWFLNNFPDPNSWLRSRQAYGRTAAVMSMVGFVLGLGDRHGENILFDSTNGDTVHVDFNCLFEKGRTFEVSENVPFRLTHNMVAGLGITGVEGIFRRACEVTMGILRNNKDSLMSVLETFVHDPLVDWLPSGSKRRADAPTEEYVAREAKKSLEPISRKLTGYQVTSPLIGKTDSQMSTENQVDSLINEAMDNRHLGRMYFGWAPYL